MYAGGAMISNAPIVLYQGCSGFIRAESKAHKLKHSQGRTPCPRTPGGVLIRVFRPQQQHRGLPKGHFVEVPPSSEYLRAKWYSRETLHSCQLKLRHFLDSATLDSPPCARRT